MVASTHQHGIYKDAPIVWNCHFVLTGKNRTQVAYFTSGSLTHSGDAGWWGKARKIHYTADIIMASSWALCTGFGAALPYIYPAFFFVMIMHRYQR